MHPLTSRTILDPPPRNTRLPAVYRMRAESDREAEVIGRRDGKTARLEAVLWLADEPLTPRKLATTADLADAAEARRLIAELQRHYDADGSAFQIEELAGGFQLLTRPTFYPWVVRLRKSAGDGKLSPTLLETLAVVAYRQPIMRAEVESIRGVHSGDALRMLMERKLIQIIGRHDSLGRPVLYGTTKWFLQSFGLKSLDELPPMRE